MDNAKKEPMISDSEEEAIKKGALRKKKRDAQTVSHAMSHPSRRLPLPMSSTFLSPSGRLLVPRSSTPPSSSASSMRVLESSALSASGVLIPGSSAPSMSGMPVLALSARFAFAVPVPGSSPPGLSPLFPIWLSQQTLVPIPKIGKLDQ